MDIYIFNVSFVKYNSYNDDVYLIKENEIWECL